MKERAGRYTAFVGVRRVAAGTLEEVLPVLKARFDRADPELVLVFEDATGQAVDFDLRGTLDEVLSRVVPPRGRGRPKLGVVSREVTLLPRHWEWLEAQPNGISAALRRVVEAAIKAEPGTAEARRLRDATGRFMTAMAGDLPGYEEASRALYAGDQARLERLVAGWPKDIKDEVVSRSREATRRAGDME